MIAIAGCESPAERPTAPTAAPPAALPVPPPSPVAPTSPPQPPLALVTPPAAAITPARPPAAAAPLPQPSPTRDYARETARYESVASEQLPLIADADLEGAWPALLQSCAALLRPASPARGPWAAACQAVGLVRGASGAAKRSVLLQHFSAFRVVALTSEPGSATAVNERGRITGYYEPLLAGSRKPSARFAVPLHRPPDDLVTVDLAELYPELKGQRVRGRIERSDKGARIVPYWSRAEINGGDRLRGLELLWVDDPIEAFFLQVQGSGRVQLADGAQVRVAYADTNGHPYRSIGRALIERGELTLEQASMQGIQAWARANPQRLRELLETNPSYVFFRERPVGDPQLGPIGSLNVPLTPGYSLAVDPRFIPMGALVLLRTSHPTTGAELTRLMAAQDTGSAIKGPLRFDFFWGFGAAAGTVAGRQRHDVSAWLFVPRGTTPQQLLPAAP